MADTAAEAARRAAGGESSAATGQPVGSGGPGDPNRQSTSADDPTGVAQVAPSDGGQRLDPDDSALPGSGYRHTRYDQSYPPDRAGDGVSTPDEARDPVNYLLGGDIAQTANQVMAALFNDQADSDILSVNPTVRTMLQRAMAGMGEALAEPMRAYKHI